LGQSEYLKEEHTIMEEHSAPSRKHVKSQKLVLFFSGLVIVLLIGSVIGVFVLVPHLSRHTTSSVTPPDLYMSTGKRILRIDAKTGKMHWQYTIPNYPLNIPNYPPDFPIPPIVANDMVYEESQDSLYAIDAMSGRLRWSHTFPSLIFPYPLSESKPVVFAHIIYISVNSDIYAFDTTSGTLLHTYHPELRGWLAQIAIDNNVLYAAGGLDLLALRLSDGAQLWHAQVNNSVRIGIPHVINGVVYVVIPVSPTMDYTPLLGNPTKYIEAFNAKTGKQLWQSSTINGDVFTTDIGTASGMIYLGSRDGSISAYDAHTGATLWQQRVGAEVLVSGAAPQIERSTVYVEVRQPAPSGSLRGIIALDARSGTTKWRYSGTMLGSVEASFYDTPIIGPGIIYMISPQVTVTHVYNDSVADDATYQVYALGTNGSVIWHITVREQL
jgi:outer membrane protein assembly factor BamB